MNTRIFTLLLFFSIGIYSIGTVQAQDFIVSQFDYHPMMLNPAQTGDYYGSVRIGGLYRDQGFTITRNPYRTPSFYIDAPIIRGFGKKDWVGVGGYFMQDQSGAGQLSTGEFLFSVAYHLSLDKNSFTYLVFGLQGGTYQRAFMEGQSLRYEDGIISGGPSVDEGLAQSMGRSEFTGAFGLMLRIQDDEGNELRFGGKLGRFFGHNYSIASRGGRARIPLRTAVHAAYDIAINERFIITPQAIYQNIGDFSEITFQARAKVPFNKEKEFYLLPGLGYRFGDAAQLLLGIQSKQLRVSLAYDMTTSSLLTANDTAGAVELALAWIIRINKKPEVNKRIFCPRL